MSLMETVPISFNEYISKIQEYKDVNLFDHTQDLKLYCYTDCNASTNDLVKQTRGLILDSDEKIVMKTFGWTPEYDVEDNWSEIVDKLSSDGKTINSNLAIFDSEEGSLIRLYNYKDKWLIATHKKLDAYSSKWSSSESFGKIYDKALLEEYNNNPHFKDFVGDVKSDDLNEKFYSKLNKDLCYLFLIRNTKENRIVCTPPNRNKLFYVGSFDREGKTFSWEELKITTPNKKELKTVDELRNYVSSIDYKQLQGVVVFNDTNQFKIVNDVYYNLFKVRGNEPSINFRFLQLRNYPDMLQELEKLYPDHIPIFEEYENILMKVCTSIHQAYISRYISKVHTVIAPEQFYIMKQCHSWHLENRVKNKVTLSKVVEIMNNQPATVLNKIIRNIKFGKISHKTPYNTPHFSSNSESSNIPSLEDEKESS